MEIHGMFEIGAPIADSPFVTDYNQYLAAALPQVAQIGLGHARHLNIEVFALREFDYLVVAFKAAQCRKRKKLDRLPACPDEFSEHA